MKFYPFYIGTFLFFALMDRINANEYCGSTFINNTNICCGGQIYQRFQNSVEMGCCHQPGKSEIYPLNQKICCGGQLIAIPPGQHLVCCNKELIDRSQYACCGNEFFGQKQSSGICCVDWKNKKSGIYEKYSERSKCCGTSLYLKDKHKCRTDHEGNKKLEAKTSMMSCGRRQYNFKNELCCSETGTVIPMPQHDSDSHQPVWKCWNGSAYDSTKYHVDTENSELILNGLEFCGKEKYSHNSKDMMCCGDKLIPITQGKNLTCCGDKLWDLDDTSKTCCNGTFIPTATKACCNNVAFETGHDYKCCDNVLYNKMTDICCQWQTSYLSTTPKQSPHDNRCCKSRETGKIQTYNNYTEVCEKGQVRIKSPQGDIKIKPPQKGIEVKPCPFCKSYIRDNVCMKKHVYKFFVYAERQTVSGTILLAVILEPYLKQGKFLNGEKIKIRTRNKCECFKPLRTFYLFTNRKIKSFKDNRYNIRFTSDDIFIRKPQTSISLQCIAHHLLGTKWKNLH